MRLEMPLSVAVLVGMAVAFLLGALLVWVSELGQRRRARRAEHTVRLLEEQVQELKARLAPKPAMLPPPPDAEAADGDESDRRSPHRRPRYDGPRACAGVSPRAVAPHCGLFKLGLEFFLANGAAGDAGASRHGPIFLDLKLHDIPNTVAGAVRAVLPLATPDAHSARRRGRRSMIEAARRAAEAAGADRPLLLAVTVLTSLDAASLDATGVAGGPTQQVLRLARLAMAAGADGLVCSAREGRRVARCVRRRTRPGRSRHPPATAPPPAIRRAR